MKHVATIIAKGEPPEWLIQGLEHFMSSPSQPGEGKRGDESIEQMRKATDTLIHLLPGFYNLPFGVVCPKEVAAILPLLRPLKKELDKLALKPKDGRPPDMTREICAGVVIEAWKLVHGKAQPRSLKLQEACEEYWKAWGGNESDPENWRRVIARALHRHAWIRGVLERYKTPTK